MHAKVIDSQDELDKRTANYGHLESELLRAFKARRKVSFAKVRGSYTYVGNEVPFNR